ncbi:MAG: hypothetical protein DBX44_06630 [Oscillospiraceae bacterium]|nr:MAG: hypothetical protein DBX44_06630 [Oscillospiraceae bacterium]
MQKKSVYSIVLSDRIVEQIDRLAYQNGMSRSAMINHILASKLSLVTPEQQMRSILSAAQQLLQDGDALQLLPTIADGMLAVKAPVRFKYNPSVRYAVELRSGSRGISGELRAAARTQSESLTQALDRFFLLFARESGLDTGQIRIENGRFSLRFLLPTSDTEEAASKIAGLIQVMQRAMEGFFDAYPNETPCIRAVRAALSDHPLS